MKSTPFLSDRQILNEIVEPFEMMFDSQTADSLIQELASQKRDAFLEAHQECTFKPNANTKFNDSMAQKKYQADMQQNGEIYE